MKIAVVEGNEKQSVIATALSKALVNEILEYDFYKNIDLLLNSIHSNYFNLIFIEIDKELVFNKVKLLDNVIGSVVLVTNNSQFSIEALNLGVFDIIVETSDVLQYSRVINKYWKRQLTNYAAVKNKLLFNGHDGLFLLSTDKINYLIGLGINTMVFHSNTNEVINKSIGHVYRQLNHLPHMYRVNRSLIVNINDIERIKPTAPREYILIFTNGVTLKLNKASRDKLANHLKFVYSGIDSIGPAD